VPHAHQSSRLRADRGKEGVLTQRGVLRESRPDKHARRDTARAFSFAAAAIIAMDRTACLRPAQGQQKGTILNSITYNKSYLRVDRRFVSV
jgi:hypothetical protein